MILGKEEILNEIKKGNLKINPFNIKNIRGSSIDLTLDNKFRIFDKDITGEDYRKYSKLVTKNEITLNPANFILPGTSNKQVLEIKNVNNYKIKIKSGMRICQLIIERMEGRYVLDSKFKNQVNL